MLPRSLIVGRIVPEGESGSDAMALQLYAYLDLRQGERGRPARGFRHAAKALGWQERTVARYARLLARVGLITINEDDGRLAPAQAVMRVVHNPARGRYNSGCVVETADLKAPPKAGSRYRHNRQPAPKIAQPEDRPLSRPVHQPEGHDTAPLSRAVHGAPVRPVHQRVHAVHQGDSTPVASDATGSRSKRSESGLSDAERAREAAVPAQPAACEECGANGRAGHDGTPWCRDHEPFWDEGDAARIDDDPAPADDDDQADDDERVALDERAPVALLMEVFPGSKLVAIEEAV